MLKIIIKKINVKSQIYQKVKIMILGESGVGKMNLIRVVTGEEFEQNNISLSSGSYKRGYDIFST